MKIIKLGHIIMAVLVVAFLLCAAPASEALATQAQREIEHVRTQLKGAVFGFAPWGMTADGQSIGGRAVPEGQKYAGVMPDMIRAVSNAIDEPVELVPVSYTRMFALLNSGQVDFAFFFRSKDSEKIAEPLVKTHEMRTIIVTRPETIHASNGALDKLIFASPRSVRYDPFFDGNEALQRIYTLDYTDAVRLLNKKRVNAVVGPDIFLLYSFRAQGLEPSDYAVFQDVTQNDVYLHFSKRSPLSHKADKVGAAAKGLVENGAFEQILIKYFTSLDVPFRREQYEIPKK